MPFMGGGLGPGGHPPDGLRRRRREAIEDHQVLEESVSTIVTDFRASVRSAAQAVRDAKSGQGPTVVAKGSLLSKGERVPPTQGVRPGDIYAPVLYSVFCA